MKDKFANLGQMFQQVQYLFFFAIKKPLKKIDVQQKEFLQDLGLLIVKNNLPLQFVESKYGLNV